MGGMLYQVSFQAAQFCTYLIKKQYWTNWHFSGGGREIVSGGEDQWTSEQLDCLYVITLKFCQRLSTHFIWINSEQSSNSCYNLFWKFWMCYFHMQLRAADSFLSQVTSLSFKMHWIHNIYVYHKTYFVPLRTCTKLSAALVFTKCQCKKKKKGNGENILATAHASSYLRSS